jgi:hypothetical protein
MAKTTKPHIVEDETIDPAFAPDPTTTPAGIVSIGKAPAPADAVDFATLWIDPQLGDAITSQNFHTVVAGKPKDFFRTVPDESYRKRTQIYVHKPEGAIDEQVYIVAPAMHGRIDEAQPCVLVTVVYRDGLPRIWPIKLPKEGMKDNDAWISARAAARAGLDKWVKIVWVRRTYKTREALPGYAPDPDFTKLPPFEDLIKLAFGIAGVIHDESHPVYRELFGIGPPRDDDDDTDL